MKNSRMGDPGEANAVSDRRSGFTLPGVLLSLTVMAILGSISLAFGRWFCACQQADKVEDQARRVVTGLTNYKDDYGFWPYFGDENGEPKRSKYGAVDYVFPVDNWIEVTRYACELPAILSGENRYGCNPREKCFEVFSDDERKGEKVYRFWIYLRGERAESTEELNRPYRLWKQLAVKVRKIRASVGDCEEVEEAMESVPVDEIYHGGEALFYIPKKDEKLHWQPDGARERTIEWSDNGRKRKENSGI